jgi:pimeloyl-ACP methyl ester carboxylesterase
MVYKPVEFRGQGRAAIAIGNPDTAEDTAVLVPGATNSVADGWLSSNEIANLYTETLAASGAGRAVSVLAWMGYDAPDSIVDPRVAQSALARKGGALLAADVNALNTTHRGGSSHVTVVGHSYGSTTVADAAAGYGMRADDIVLVGSPGTDMARTASDFHLPDGGHVYVGSAATDPVTNIAGMPQHAPVLPIEPIGLGADPAADGFGSTRFKAEVPGWTWQSGNDHDDYFETGSESLYSMADITSGHGGALQGHGMTAPHRDAVLGPFAARLGLPDWSVPLLDPELLRPATTGHHHVPPQVAGR